MPAPSTVGSVSTVSSSTGSSSASVTVPSGCTLALIFAGFYDGGATITSFTLAGTGATRITRVTATGNGQAEVWYVQNPSSGSQTFSWVHGGGAFEEGAVFHIVYLQDTASSSFVTNSGGDQDNASISIVLTSSTNDLCLIGGEGWTIGGGFNAAPTSSGQTVIASASNNSGEVEVATEPGAASVTMTATGSYIGGVAVSIAGAAAGGATLTVADAACVTQTDAVTLTQAHSLTVNDGASTTQTDNVVITLGTITLVVADCFSTSQTDAVTLSQVHNLTVNDGSSTTQTDNVVLSQVHNLILADSFSTSQVDSLVLSQLHNLILEDLFSTTQTDAVTLVYAGTLVIQDLFCTTQTDNVVLSQLHNLLVNDLFSITQTDIVVLIEYIHLPPASDSYIGNWTTDTGATTNLYQAVDEALAFNDSDYIQSEQSPSSSPVVLALTSGNDPLSSDGHILRYRYALDGSGTVNLVVQLRQGYTNEASPGTLIAEWTHNSIGAITTAEQTLSGAQADSISNYGNLFVRMVATEV